MSERSLAGFVRRVRSLSISDPSPDARSAYEVVLNLLSRVDEGNVADVIRETAPRPIPDLPRTWPVIVDADRNEDADWRYEEMHG